MTSSKKSRKNKDINLETDLLLTPADFTRMKKVLSPNSQDLESYFDFLEDINAFESRKVKTKFYDAVFEL
jgi:hypothetical protein